MNEKKCGGKKGGKKRLVLGLIGILALSCSGESFYQSYVNVSTNGIAITNLGVNPILVSGILSQAGAVNDKDVYVGYVRGVNTTLVYTVTMSNHTSFYLSKTDLAGIWLIKDDKFFVTNGGVTNRIQINVEESR